MDESGSPETIDISFNLDLNLQIMQEETAEGILIMDFKGVRTAFCLLLKTFFMRLDNILSGSFCFYGNKVISTFSFRRSIFDRSHQRMLTCPKSLLMSSQRAILKCDTNTK